jgi:hypothetical protein
MNINRGRGEEEEAEWRRCLGGLLSSDLVEHLTVFSKDGGHILFSSNKQQIFDEQRQKSNNNSSNSSSLDFVKTIRKMFVAQDHGKVVQGKLHVMGHAFLPVICDGRIIFAVSKYRRKSILISHIPFGFLVATTTSTRTNTFIPLVEKYVTAMSS